MEELNKKLAEWAGLELMWGRLEGKDYERTILVFKDANGYSLDADGNRLETLAFTQSLDACWKWLVPKVVEGDIHIETYITDEDTAVALMRACDTVAWVCDKTPALALCLAIEKLINSEKDNATNR